MKLESDSSQLEDTDVIRYIRKYSQETKVFQNIVEITKQRLTFANESPEIWISACVLLIIILTDCSYIHSK